jgi:Na+:H+ antiporter, NhaC family
VNPLIAALLGFRGITIDKLPEGEPVPEIDSAARG